jgi:Raf kinase inhibitor-like YbhB/YbcL family protein
MKSTAWIAGVALAAAASLVAQAQAPAAQPAAGKPAHSFTLTSPDITGGKIAPAQVFNGFGCSGGNLSPALTWSGVPAGTRSFALLMYDPDAPTGSGWWHWLLYNLPASLTSLPAGAGDPHKNLLPAGALQGRTDFGTPGYGGPCPPPGKPHHYHFWLYALKVDKLDVPTDATAAYISFSVHAQALGHAELTGVYGR